MNLTINETSRIDFTLSIAGTQTQPSSVRVVLGDGPRLSFDAKSQDGLNWTSLVTPLREVVGQYTTFAIEVVLGDKIITPIKRQITIQDSTIPVQAVVVDPVQSTPVEPTIEPVVAAEVPTVVEPVAEFGAPVSIEVAQSQAAVNPEPVENTPIEVKAVDSEEKKKASKELLSLLQNTSKVTEAKVLPPMQFAPAKIEMKKMAAAATKAKPIKKIEVFNDKQPTGIETDKEKVTKAIFAESVDNTPRTKQVHKPAPVIVTKIPLVVVKEDIVYR